MVVHQLDTMGEPRNGPVQQELKKISGVLSVPQVFINGAFMGEAETVDEMVRKKTLVETFTTAGGEFK